MSAAIGIWGTVCRGGRALRSFINRISTLLLALLLVIGIPTLPVFIEWAKAGAVRNTTYLITAAVLAATLGLWAEHDLYRFGYGTLFLITIVLYTLTVGGPVATGVDRYSGFLLLAVALSHASERFWWHVVLNRSLADTFGTSKGVPNE